MSICVHGLGKVERRGIQREQIDIYFYFIMAVAMVGKLGLKRQEETKPN